jgi:hypothetical protein
MSNKVQAGAFFKIPLSDAIFEAKKYLKIEDTMDDDFLEILAWNAVRFIMPLSSVDTVVEKFEVCNGVVELPKNVIKFLWFRFCNLNTDANVPTTFNNSFIYADIPFLKNCGCGDDIIGANVRNVTNVVRINDNKLQFRFAKNLPSSELEVAFVGYATDEEGVFTVTDDVKQAVVYRICSEYSTVNSQSYDNWQKNTWNAKATAMTNRVRSTDFDAAFRENIDQIQGIARAMNYPLTLSRSRSRY